MRPCSLLFKRRFQLLHGGVRHGRLTSVSLSASETRESVSVFSYAEEYAKSCIGGVIAEILQR